MRTYTVRGVETLPIDQLARRVAGRGEDPKTWRHRYVSGDVGRVPLETIKPPRTIEDLTGVNRDRLTVVGYLWRRKLSSKGNSHHWLARCRCGEYVVRRGLTIRRGRAAATPDSCQGCRNQATRRRFSSHHDSGLTEMRKQE